MGAANPTEEDEEEQRRRLKQLADQMPGFEDAGLIRRKMVHPWRLNYADWHAY